MGKEEEDSVVEVKEDSSDLTFYKDKKTYHSLIMRGLNNGPVQKITDNHGLFSTGTVWIVRNVFK